jgi:ABC-type bacteriocin/lantibiotic exporter with double-glycine peptidase domain
MISREHPADIEFRAVEFGYSRKKDLLSVSALRVVAGEHIAIAGKNGAGKSTLVKLMARLYDPVCGSIHLGGEDMRNLHLKSLRQSVCYLPRDPVLFDGSIISNLRFVRPATSERELEEATHLVGLSAFVASLRDGFRQRIGPDGCQLSGGERQRLALARAILQKPRVLILDEATSCLDSSAEACVLGRLQEISGWSLIVISHRQTTFKSFARVLTLSGGRIVEDCRANSIPMPSAGVWIPSH